MTVFASGFSSQALGDQIAAETESRVIPLSRHQFDDKEIQLTLTQNTRGVDHFCLVASAAGDPNKQEKEARLIMRAAERAGAKSITLILPYMWYGRSDDNWDERKIPALTDTIETLRGLCDNVIVVDPHNHSFTREKFLDGGARARNCQTIHMGYPLAVQLKRVFSELGMGLNNLLLSHADPGSTKRISRSFRGSIYNVLEMDRNPDQDDWAIGLKARDKRTNKIKYHGFSQDVIGKDVVIFEDMIASGGTACELATLLKSQGARSIILCATNGLFTPKKGESVTASVDRINNSDIDAVFIMDTYDHSLVDPDIHAAIQNSPIIHTVPSAPYLAAVIQALHTPVDDDMVTDENSISALSRGQHPRQLGQGQPVAATVPLKSGSPLLRLKSA